jgi:hypothetical protein
VAHEIRIAVGASQFEVPVVGRQPSVDHLPDDDATVSKNQRTWRLLAAVACVALDANAEEPRFRHPIIIRPCCNQDFPRSESAWEAAAALIDGPTDVGFYWCQTR